MGRLVIDPIPKCTYITDLNPDTNYGSDVDLVVLFRDAADKNPNEVYRTLIDADIASIPAGQVIQSTSKLEIYVTDVSRSGAARIHRITEAGWTENGATWNAYDGVNGWTDPGGDYSTPEVPFTTPGAAGWFTITGADLASFLQDALDSRAGIARMLLKIVTESGASKGWFAANSDDAASNRPRLTVDYGPPSVADKGHPWVF